jgi:hypothetical protein
MKILISLRNFILVMITLSACIVPSCRNKNTVTEPAIVAKTPVTTDFPVFRDISDSIDLPAITTYLKRNMLRSTVTGVVESASIVQGEAVEKGIVAFTIRTKEAAAMKNIQPGDTSLGIKGLIRILTPQDGVISSVVHQAGDFVQEGDELAVIADNKSLVFMLQVPYELTGLIKLNGVCSLLLPDYKRIQGRITGRFPEMDRQNQTISFIVNAGNISKLPENLIASGFIVKNPKTRTAGKRNPDKLLGNEAYKRFNSSQSAGKQRNREWGSS